MSIALRNLTILTLFLATIVAGRLELQAAPLAAAARRSAASHNKKKTMSTEDKKTVAPATKSSSSSRKKSKKSADSDGAPRGAAKKASKIGESKSRSRKNQSAKKISAVARHLHRTFEASAELRPMARQLMVARSAAAYAGVEEYARRHAASDAGALAYLTLGYAHLLDHQYESAIADLERAQSGVGELRDYVRYLEASAYAGENNDAKVVELLQTFASEAPESVFASDALDLYAGALLALGRNDEVIALLQPYRQPTRASVELKLGQAYLRSAHPETGMAILRHLYFSMPTCKEAAVAAVQLTAAGSTLMGSYADERRRADLLAQAGRSGEAARAYRALLVRAPESERGGLQVALGAALRKNDPAEARQLLINAQAWGEDNAQRLYDLSEMARNAGDTAAVETNLASLRQAAPSSPWFEQALLTAANMYLLDKNYERAIACYRELSDRFPSGQHASYAHWKAAWLTYRLGRVEQARRDFEDQVRLFGDQREVPAALYWRARLAENAGDYATARAWYSKLSDRFHNYYYGYLGRARLAQLPASGAATPQQTALLADIAPTAPLSLEALATEAPEGELRAEKAQLLVNAGLYDFARRELEAERGGKGACWATLAIARIYYESGETHRALQFLKRAVPNYYALDIAALPRAYWEILFPHPYWSELRARAAENGLDANLVASLIRQESEFNPGALSHANAMGLMQLLPQVGSGAARTLGVKRFSPNELLEPSVNLQLGTHYFKRMVDHYNGQVEYALAAYNAGSNRVDEWLQTGSYHDVPEFVESIPFTETREYVQAIMRNRQVYQRLYEAQP